MPDKKKLPCCQREVQVGEYLLSNMMGPLCVGCWLATDLERQDGKGNPQSEALRGVPFVIPPDRVKAMREHPDTTNSFLDFRPKPDAN